MLSRIYSWLFKGSPGPKAVRKSRTTGVPCLGPGLHLAIVSHSHKPGFICGILKQYTQAQHDQGLVYSQGLLVHTSYKIRLQTGDVGATCEQFVQERIRLQNDRPGPTYLVLDCPGEYIFDSVGYAAIQASAKELGVTVVVMVSPDSIPWSIIGTFDTVTLDKYRHFTAGQKHGILGKYLKNTVDMMTLLRSWRQYRYYTVERV